MEASWRTCDRCPARIWGATLTEQRCACSGGAEGLDLLSVAFLNGGLIPGLHKPSLQMRILHNKYVGPWMGPLMTESRLSAALAKTFGPHTQPTQGFVEDSYAALTFNSGHIIMHE